MNTRFDQATLDNLTARYRYRIPDAQWEQAKNPIPLIESLLSSEQIIHAVVEHPGTKTLMVVVQTIGVTEEHARHIRCALDRYLSQMLRKSVHVMDFRLSSLSGTTCALLVQWKTTSSVPRFVGCYAQTDRGASVESFTKSWQRISVTSFADHGDTSALTLAEVREFLETSVGVIPLFLQNNGYTWRPIEMVRGYVNEVTVGELPLVRQRMWTITIAPWPARFSGINGDEGGGFRFNNHYLGHVRPIVPTDSFARPVREGDTPFERSSRCEVCNEKIDITSSCAALVPHVDAGLSSARAVSIGWCCQMKAKLFDLHHKNGVFVWTKKKTLEEERRDRENRIVHFGENAPAGAYASAWLCAVAALKETGLDWRSLTKEFMAEFTAVVLAFHRARLDGEPFEQACAKHKTYAPGDAVTKALCAYERSRPKGVTVPSVRPVHRSLLTLEADLDD